jgi:hypothetical protein
MSFKIIELHNNTLKVFEDGNVLVLGRYKPNKDEFYEKKCQKDKDGYLRLNLSYKRKQKNYLIHRLVAFSFLNLDLENKKSEVDHKDRDNQNNVVSNLRIVNHQQNQFNRYFKGYCNRGKTWQSRIQLMKKMLNKHMKTQN